MIKLTKEDLTVIVDVEVNNEEVEVEVYMEMEVDRSPQLMLAIDIEDAMGTKAELLEFMDADDVKIKELEDVIVEKKIKLYSEHKMTMGKVQEEVGSKDALINTLVQLIAPSTGKEKVIAHLNTLTATQVRNFITALRKEAKDKVDNSPK